MLKMWARRTDVPKSLWNIDKSYPLYANKTWYNDLAIKAIEEIDGNRYIGDGVSESRVYGIIAPDWLSGGTKTLIYAMHNPDVLCPLANLGDNCAHLLNLISQEYDITFTYMFSLFMFEPTQKILCMETGNIVTGFDEYWNYWSSTDEDIEN